jgi:hypothetical protein
MKVLAIAKTNKNYIWAKNFSKCTIEAVLENDHISFLEYFNNHVNTLSEELIQSLFPRETNIEISEKDCPFLLAENRDFYAILHRKEPLYHAIYKEIVVRAVTEEFAQTEPTIIKKTFKRTK